MKKLFLTIIMAALWCGLAWAYDFSAVCSTGQTLYYRIISSGVIVDPQNSSYPYYTTTYPTGNLVIPTSVMYNSEEYWVVGISSHAFDGCNGITSVTIGNSIGNSVSVGIGSYAFNGCSSLTTINFNATACSSVGTDAWAGCTSLTTLNIGSNVTRIPDNGFSGCSRISSITIPSSVTHIGEGAFANCSGLTTVNYNATNCTIMGNYPSLVFDGCTSLSTLNIGSNVIGIPVNAFRGCCRITALTIPSSVTTIGGSAFEDCSGLATVNFNATNCTTMGSNISPVFPGCTSLSTLNIGSNVTNIPAYAFYDCSSLTSVTISNSVTTIGESAFSYCSGLTSVTIPSSVTAIAEKAFSYCSGLATVNFNATNCTTMGSFYYPVFYNCNASALINIGRNVTKIPVYAFKGILGSGDLTISNSVMSIGSSAFDGCRGLTSITIPNSVTSIGSSAFSNCSGLTSVYYTGNIAQWCEITFDSNPLSYAHNLYVNNELVTDLVIPSTITTIKDYTFAGASCLTSVTISNSVTSIGESAFYNCSGLTELTLGESLTSIGESAFENCSGLTSVAISNSVENIGGYAFRNCSGLTSVTISNSVTNIGRYAFEDCSELTSINIPNSVTSIGGYAFRNCFGLIVVTIGNSVTGIGASAFYGCSGLMTLNFNATNCTTMGSSAYPVFDNCRSLSTLNIGSNVTNIPDNAFYGCSGLTSVTIPNSVASIGRNAFRNCSSLTEMIIPFVGSSATATTASASTLFGYIFGYSTSSQTGTIRQYYASNGSIYAYIPSSLRSVTVTGGRLLYGAFYNCSMLTSVTIGEDVTNIGNSAFYNCSGLTDIYVNRTTPPTALSSSFNNRTATVWVPCGSATAYSSAAGWSGFSDIRESRAYMLSVSSANLQQGTARVTQQPDCTNGTAVIEAIPSIGYTFAQWNDGNTDNPRTITVSNNITYIAEFGISQHNITVVSADMSMGTANGSGIYDYGTEIQITATPSDGYRFAAWNDGNTDNPRTITVMQDSTFTANFIAIYTITVQSNNDEIGSVSGGGVYDVNTEVEISAIPVEHYHFVQWNDGNTDNPRTITVTEDATYTAEFAIDQHTISVESTDLEMGTVSEGGTYDYGAEIQISATANEGYRFVAWNDENTDNPRTLIVTQDSTFTASFVAIYTITVLSDNEEMGSVEGSGIYDENAEIEISATAAEHYHFTRWNDENTDNPRTLIVTEDAEYTASFAIDQHAITIESADTAMGTVSGNGTYDYGTEIEISANANEHYHFVQWADGNTENPRTITVTEDAIYTAEFAIDQHTITVESADVSMGTVSAGGTYDYGTEIQISATAAIGYEFAQWTDGSTDNPRIITVTGDATYIASFVPATGINENTILEISLFPNPATDILNITSSEIISEIEIVNVMGQMVRRIEVNSDNAVCDVEGLVNGVYVVRIRHFDRLSERKFIKE